MTKLSFFNIDDYLNKALPFSFFICKLWSISCLSYGLGQTFCNHLKTKTFAVFLKNYLKTLCLVVIKIAEIQYQAFLISTNVCNADFLAITI